MARTAAPKTKRTNGEGSVWWSATESRWRLAFHDAEGHRRVLSARSEADANRVLSDCLRERDQGTLGYSAGKIPTLAHWLDKWLSQHSRRLAPRTVERYRSDITNHLKPSLGRVRLDRLTPLAIESMYARLQDEGLSSTSTKHVHSVLRASLREALRLGIIGHDVMSRVRAPKTASPRVNPLTLQEVEIVLAQAESEGPQRLARTMLALRWGPRQGEALGLRWSDIDLTTGRVQIRQAVQRVRGKGLVVTTPKSRAGERSFVLDPTTIAALQAWRKKQREQRIAATRWDQDDLVFTTAYGGYIDPRNDSRAWTATLKAAAVRHVRLHDARHTAATLLLHAGVGPRTVMEVLGHSNWSLTMNTYAHPTMDMLAAAATQVEAMIT